jgi:outer membrane protein OmpA-like peptidoglycan-associated protein
MLSDADRRENWKRLIELRNLIIGDEIEKLKRDQTDEGPPPITAEEVSNVLAAAIVHEAKHEGNIATALTPIIEESLDSSVKRNPQMIADAIFPVIGPAIRKSIAETLRGMIESLNATLQHGFTAKGMKWRIEAMKTGRPFAEVALSHSLLYRVEQIYLIHNDSGLLLQHVVQDSIDAADGDMVSGMLTAIQDFVHDSFDQAQGGTLNTLEVGELSVWIERGPHTVLAAVIRGSAPESLRILLKETIETILLEKHEELEDFAGDSAVFDDTLPYLRNCLMTRTQEEEKAGGKSMIAVWILLGILVVSLVTWGTVTIQNYIRVRSFASTLFDIPGIVVTDTYSRDGVRIVTGLRDPLAENVDSLARVAKLDSTDVMFNWRPYQSLHPLLVVARARLLLDVPPTVLLSYGHGVLTAMGTAPQEWVKTVVKSARFIPGVNHFVHDRLMISDLLDVARKIEESVVHFDSGSSEFGPDQKRELDGLASTILELVALVGASGSDYGITVVGQADTRGSRELNIRLSRERAQKVLAGLEKRGIPATRIRTVGVGATVYDASGVSGTSIAAGRHVKLKISFRPHSAREGSAR